MPNKLKNPIIPGFYPDPSICRVGNDFYLACSSFELCPGVSVFHSRELANWEQIGYAVTPKNGFHVEKNCGNGGVMAPTLRYYNGLFYIINTNYSYKCNYIVTAENPAGPWSNLHWLTDAPGIDASIFFDHDGRPYIIGTGDVWDNGTDVKEWGIWLASYDIENFCLTGEPVTIFMCKNLGRETLKELCIADGKKINSEIVGCMTGTIVGMYATGNGRESENFAEFDWFEMIFQTRSSALKPAHFSNIQNFFPEINTGFMHI